MVVLVSMQAMLDRRTCKRTGSVEGQTELPCKEAWGQRKGTAEWPSREACKYLSRTAM